MTVETARPARAWSFARYPSLAVLLALLIGGLVIGAAVYGGDDESTDGSGVPAAETRSTPAFSAVHLSGTNEVRITVGPRRSVVVHADDNLVDQVSTTVEAGVLNVSEQGSFTASSPMYVDVSVPALDAVTLTGTGAVSVQGIDTDLLRVELPETGTGAVTATGSVRRLNARLGGTGDLQLSQLRADEADVTLSGTGRIETQVTGTLRATLSGDGAILYSGNPASVVENVTGTGAILPG